MENGEWRKQRRESDFSIILSRWRREKAEERKRLEDLGIIPRIEEFKPAKNAKAYNTYVFKNRLKFHLFKHLLLSQKDF